MAQFDFTIPADFVKKLGRMADIERVAPKMIDEAIPILERNVKQEVARHTRTGDLYRSIKTTKAKMAKDGSFSASVQPTGTDSKGVRNMEKLVYLEYGTKKQQATPVLTKAIKDSKPAVMQKMQEVFEREVVA